MSGPIAQWEQALERMASQEPLPPSIPALLRRAVQQGDGTLVEMFEPGTAISYVEFERSSRRLAAALLHAGVTAGTKLALMLENCIEFQVTWFALARIGAVIVPVNPSYTQRELLYVLSDSDAEFLVHSTRLPAELIASIAIPPERRIPVEPDQLGAREPLPACDSPWHRMLAAVPDDVVLPGLADDLERVINIQYTSGTTGFPKGCVLTHGYWLNLAQATVSLHRETMERFFTAQPFFYMDPFWQLLEAMWCHGTLVAAKKISASRFLGWLAEHRVHRAQLPELTMKHADAVPPGSLHLRLALTLGWSAASRAAFVERFGVRTMNVFGMTEIGVGLSPPPDWQLEADYTSVGVAALRRRARVVDAQGQTVPPGTPGELQIAGAHIFKGYYKKPEVNAQCLVDGWFSTGDAFVQDEKGFFSLVGRFKDMIRRSAENISAREVEAVVREHPAVLDCAAVPVPDAERGEEVKILVQLVEGSPPQGGDWQWLIGHCQARLAPFKVPRFYEAVAEFPRTSSNKISKPSLIAAARDGRRGFDRLG